MTRPERAARKPLAMHLDTGSNVMTVLCDDGAVWERTITANGLDDWRETPPVPGSVRHLEVRSDADGKVYDNHRAHAAVVKKWLSGEMDEADVATSAAGLKMIRVFARKKLRGWWQPLSGERALFTPADHYGSAADGAHVSYDRMLLAVRMAVDEEISRRSRRRRGILGSSSF